MNEYSIDDIIRVDPLSFVRQNAWRFFRGEPSPWEALEYLISDAIALGAECTAYRAEDWWLAFSASDWLANARVSPSELFSCIVPAPEQGLHAMRHEILVGVFAEDVCTYDGSWHQLSGKREPPLSIRSQLAESVRRAVAFYWRLER